METKSSQWLSNQLTSWSSTLLLELDTQNRRMANYRKLAFSKCDLNQFLLFQKYRGTGHHGYPSPIPHHNDEDAGCEEGLHSKPDLSEASILVDSLDQNQI